MDAAVETLHLPNVQVMPERAEQSAAVVKPDVITARAVAPLHKLLDLFSKALKQGSELILYKGPDIESEIAECHLGRRRAEVLMRYELPYEMGSRTIVRIW